MNCLQNRNRTFLNFLIKESSLNKVQQFVDSTNKVYILSEVSQRQISYNIIYKWNLKKDTNELFTKQK